MKNTTWIVGALLVCLAGAPLVAEEAPPMPQITEEHKHLETWIGKWKGSGEMKPGVFGDGGPMNWTEECDWFEGSKLHIVCTSEGTSPMGPSKGLGVIGYHVGRGVWTHYGVDNNGWSDFARGKRDGKRWTYHSEDVMGGQTFHTRFTLEMVSPNRMTFTWDMSEDGENWMNLMEGASVKQ